MALAISLTISGKLLSLFKDVLLANVFGSSYTTDSYFTALAIPTLVWSAGYATISSVLLPIYLSSVNESSHEAQKVAREGVKIYFMIAFASAVFVWGFADTIVSMTLRTDNESAKQLAICLTKILTLGFVFTGYVEVQNVIQRAHGRFLAPLFIPTVNNVFGIFAVLVAGYYGNIIIVIIGATVAWMMQAPIQRFQTRDLYVSDLSWSIRRKTIKKVAYLSLPIALAVLLDQVNLYVGIVLASDFGSGAISHFNYASRLAIFAAGLFSWLISYFFFPQIARNASLNEDALNGRVLLGSIALILFSTAPLVVVGLAMRTEIVEVVFGRGAFTRLDVLNTSAVFGFYALGIIFISLREILNRAFFAYQKTFAPLLIGIIATLVNISVSYLLSNFMGIKGIALGMAISSAVFVVLQFFALWRLKPALVRPEIKVFFTLTLIAAVPSYITAIYTAPFYLACSALVRLIIVSATTLSIYCVTSLLLLRLAGWSAQTVVGLLKTPTPAKQLDI